jgi:putative protein-disulfide isomerase
VSEARDPRLLYVADPLCSWCYGFGPELSRLLERHPELGLDLLMGGLRPGNTEPMSEAFREMLRGHWAHVAEMSGLAFSEAIFAAPGFVYDTEPPCRAVVTARALDPSRAFALMKEIQSAFYRDGIDMTRADALADAAQRCGYDRAAFAAALEAPAMREATRADFARSRSLGITGFPTLALAVTGELYLVASGYTRADVLEERIAQIVQRLHARLADDDTRHAV